MQNSILSGHLGQRKGLFHLAQQLWQVEGLCALGHAGEVLVKKRRAVGICRPEVHGVGQFIQRLPHGAFCLADTLGFKGGEKHGLLTTKKYFFARVFEDVGQIARGVKKWLNSFVVTRINKFINLEIVRCTGRLPLGGAGGDKQRKGKDEKETHAFIIKEIWKKGN